MNKILSIGLATAASLFAFGALSQAATITWSNNSTNWTTGSNWVGGVAPVNGYSTDSALFTNVSTAQPYINTTGRAVNGIDVQIAAGGIDMTSAAGADIGVGTGGIDATTQLSGTNTIRPDVFKFGNGSSYSTSSIFAQTTSTATDSTFTFSSPSIQLNNGSGTIEIQSRRAAGSGFGKGVINISGVISGNNTSSLGLLFNGATASNGAGTFNKDYNFVNLTGNNSFNSKIALNGITLTANSLANANSNSALGASGDIVLGGIGGTFANSSKQNSSLVFNNLASNVSTDRLLFVTGGTSVDVTHSLLNNDSSYTVSFNNTGSAIDSTSTTGSRTIQFGGTNTGDNTFAEVIGDPSGGGKGGVSKVDGGKWVLTGNNTYTGNTTISAGTLEIGAAGRLGGGNYSATITNNGTLLHSGTNAQTLSGVISGTGNLTQNSSSTLTLSAANNYTGTTTVNAGTLSIANTMAVGAITGSGNLSLGTGYTLTTNASSDTTYSGGISGSGTLAKSGSGTLTLSGSNTYSGGTALNTGTLVIGNTAAAGSGTITQSNGSSLLKIDTTGTIANAMSIYNVSANKTVTLSGGITVNNAVFDVASGETLTISNTINGTGGVTKNGTGTLVLSGNNTYQSATIINSGTLEAANAGALGSNNTVEVTGGTLLVTADDAINGKNIELSTNTIGLKFSGNYSGAMGSLTLSADSSIDLGGGSVRLLLQGITFSSYNLSFYNWTGLTLWAGGTGADTDRVFLLPAIDPSDLNKISFYSGDYGTDSFLGTGFDLGLEATGFTPAWGYQIIPVPEPETYATGLLLLLGGAWWMWRKRTVEAGNRKA